MHKVMPQWAPPLERSRLMATSLAGVKLGAAITMAMCGYLIKTYGWASTFYASGMSTSAIGIFL